MAKKFKRNPQKRVSTKTKKPQVQIVPPPAPPKPYTEGFPSGMFSAFMVYLFFILVVVLMYSFIFLTLKT